MFRLSRDAEPAFIPYVMCGDPDVETTEAIVHALTRAGAAAIELGVPYGDPLADGPTIAAAGVRALSGGTGLRETLALAARVAGSSAPIVLFSYVNPVLQYGIERFCAEAAAAGIAGAIVPDVTLEETGELRAALARAGLAMPLLVAPSTPIERARTIAAAATGFVYVVSRLGVTGAGDEPDFSPLLAQIAQLRGVTDAPLAVGFGISSAGHVDRVRDAVDGVIVGSALIDAYAGARGTDAAERVKRAVQALAISARQDRSPATQSAMNTV